jgi:RNA polymerase sigma-70 factor (ECF subfamily)
MARDLRSVRISESHSESPLVARDRTGTPVYQRTEVKQVLRALRASLPEDDQVLLDLRMSARFSWKDVARIQLGLDEAVPELMVDKEAARLRKRFQLVTERLRQMAVEAGIVMSRTQE